MGTLWEIWQPYDQALRTCSFQLQVQPFFSPQALRKIQVVGRQVVGPKAFAWSQSAYFPNFASFKRISGSVRVARPGPVCSKLVLDWLGPVSTKLVLNPVNLVQIVVLKTIIIKNLYPPIWNLGFYKLGQICYQYHIWIFPLVIYATFESSVMLQEF